MPLNVASPRLKLVVLVARLGMGGAEVQALRNCEALLRNGHAVRLTTLFRSDEDFFAAELRGLQARFPHFSYTSLLNYPDPDRTFGPWDGSRKLWGCVSTLRHQLGDWRPDILYTRSWYASLVAYLATRSRRPSPRLLFNEENSFHHNPGWLRGWLRRFLLAQADGWFVPCQGLYEEALALRIAPDKGQVLANVMRMPEAASLAVRAQEATGDRPLRLGFLGRIEAQKGPERLLALAERLEGLGVPFELQIAGQGTLELWLHEQINARGLVRRMRLVGPVRDLGAFFAKIDVLVLTSHYEGFANVLIEANAHGVPVVAMNAPHGPADIVRDGQNGYLVANGDLDAMAARLAQLSPAQARAMLPACRRLAEEHYSIEAQMRRWEGILGAAPVWRQRFPLTGTAS